MTETATNNQKLSLAQIHERQRAWADRNFPKLASGSTINGYRQILGMVEELGELAEAHAAMTFGPAGGTEASVEAAKDAVADITIYAMNYLYSRGWRVDNDGDYDFVSSGGLVHAQQFLGRLAHSHLKEEQGIRGTPEAHQHNARTAMSNLLKALHAYCCFWGWDYEQVVTDTWLEVEKRDWVKYPKNGRSE